MNIDALAGLDLATVMLAALIAGVLDAAVGSGGAVLLPALIAVSPSGASAGVPLAVNKAVAVSGNLIAAARYHSAQGQKIGTGLLAATITCALAGVLVGVWIATQIDVTHLMWLAVIALSVLVVTLLLRGKKPRAAGFPPPLPRRSAVPIAVGGIAVYDGMIGPATGSLLQLTLQRLLARPIHECLALARLIQALLNLTAAAVLWVIVNPDPWLILSLAELHALGGAIGATITRRISATVLHYALIVCIALAVIRMLVAN